MREHLGQISTIAVLTASISIGSLAQQGAMPPPPTAEAQTPAQQQAVPPAAQVGPAAASSSAEGNEIVVTATKREEGFQDVSATITAFTEQAIERSSITRPIDFINATPNISAAEANNAGYLRVTIRGDAQALNTDPPVAVVLTGATGLNKDLLDLPLIEALKGRRATSMVATPSRAR